jgi:hypothetical protein
MKDAPCRFTEVLPLISDDRWTVVDEVVIGVGGIGPAPGVGEGVELCLAYRAAWLAKENVVIRVRVKWRIEINKIDTRIRKLAAVAQPFEVIAEVEPVH